MTSVLIIDDHEVLADCLAMSLRDSGIDEVRTISPTAGDILANLPSNPPDLALVDLDLGAAGSEGTELIPALIAQSVTTVVFTGSEDEPTLGRCLERGAVGVIRKSSSFTNVVEQVLDGLAGREINTELEKYGWLLAASRERNDNARALEPFERLTPRESAVLAGLIDGRRVDDIAEQSCVSVVTVRSQVRAIFQKLGVGSQLAAVALARKARWAPAFAEDDARSDGNRE